VPSWRSCRKASSRSLQMVRGLWSPWQIAPGSCAAGCASVRPRPPGSRARSRGRYRRDRPHRHRPHGCRVLTRHAAAFTDFQHSRFSYCRQSLPAFLARKLRLSSLELRRDESEALTRSRLRRHVGPHPREYIAGRHDPDVRFCQGIGDEICKTFPPREAIGVGGGIRIVVRR
jgi:hypothetical protein